MEPLDGVATAGDWYATFAERDARRTSPVYADWAAGISRDPELLRLIGTLPMEKRQPNLVLGAVRYLGLGPVGFDDLRVFLRDRWTDVVAVVSRRRTQTNEPGRCATLLPVLTALDGPLALLEVGASAGLCLYPDRYSYRYTSPDASVRLDPVDGPSTVVLDCECESEPAQADGIPTTLPEVVWRAGIDLSPQDVSDRDDLAWLDALIWPGHEARRTRLTDAATIVAADPPQLFAGDLNERLGEVAAQAPHGARLVVLHSAVLAYLDAPARSRFVAAIQDLDATWVSNEGQLVVPGVADRLPPASDAGHRFVLAVDGEPRALVDPHGASYHPLG